MKQFLIVPAFLLFCAEKENGEMQDKKRTKAKTQQRGMPSAPVKRGQKSPAADTRPAKKSRLGNGKLLFNVMVSTLTIFLSKISALSMVR